MRHRNKKKEGHRKAAVCGFELAIRVIYLALSIAAVDRNTVLSSANVTCLPFTDTANDSIVVRVHNCE